MSKVSDILINAGLQQKQMPGLKMPSLDPNVYTIYGEDWCGYTSAARQFLDASRKKYHYISFRGNRILRNQFSHLYAFGHGTIPLIFKGQKFIGGFEQLKNDF